VGAGRGGGREGGREGAMSLHGLRESEMTGVGIGRGTGAVSAIEEEEEEGEEGGGAVAAGVGRGADGRIDGVLPLRGGGRKEGLVRLEEKREKRTVRKSKHKA